MGLCCASIQAQNLNTVQEKEQKIKLTGGVIAESNLSGFIHSGIDGGNADMGVGAGLGGFLNLGISKSFSIQGEMTFQYKSSNFALGNQSGGIGAWKYRYMPFIISCSLKVTNSLLVLVPIRISD